MGCASRFNPGNIRGEGAIHEIGRVVRGNFYKVGNGELKRVCEKFGAL